jgi:hypothetical protein
MDWLYLLLKVLHVTGVIVWIGGMLALVIINSRVGRAGDMAQLEVLGRLLPGHHGVRSRLLGLVLLGRPYELPERRQCGVMVRASCRRATVGAPHQAALSNWNVASGASLSHVTIVTPKS